MASRSDRLPAPEGHVRRSSGEEAARYIHRLIFEGDIRPGERVPQDEIAQMLGISRIPLREALIALEREGWVTLEMHRGAFVNALDQEAVRDHYALFGVIYRFAVERALAKSRQELVERLAAIEQQLQAEDDPAVAGALAFEFHSTVVDGARSPRLKVVLRAMSSLVPGDFFVVVPGALQLELRSLSAIVRALRQGDTDRAADEYERMMRAVGNEVVGLLEQRGLFDAEEPAPVPSR